MRRAITTSKSGRAYLALGLTIFLGCGLAPEEESIDETSQPITGGGLVTSNVAPWNSVVELDGICTGTKIGSRRFLTAAHCFPNTSAGATIRITNALTPGAFTSFVISKIDRHPSFDHPVGRVYEATVIVVDRDSPGIPSLPLRSAFVGDNVSVTIVGYGCDEAAGSTNGGKKQRATLTTQFNADQDIRVHFVTTRLDSKARVCPGDSGGPMLLKNSSGQWQVAGVAAGFGPEGASSYSRTGSVRRWIAAPAKNVFANNENGNFLNGKSGKCIGINGASTANGAQSAQFFCDSRNLPDDNQSWQLRDVGGGRFNFVNRNSGLCLGVDGASVSDGALLQQFNCASPDPNNNQAWRFVRTSGDFFQVVNAKSNKCIGVSGGSTANGAVLAQFTCSTLGSINNQSWLFTR